MVGRQRRTRPRQRSVGPGSSRRDSTSSFAPAAEGWPSLCAKGWRVEPSGGGAAPPPLPVPVPEPPRAAAPELPGHRITHPGRGRGRGRRVERSRRELQHAAVIERWLARPSPGCSPPTQPFIHSSIRLSIHSTHPSLQTRVRPIVGPLDYRLLSQGPYTHVRPGSLHFLLLAL